MSISSFHTGIDPNRVIIKKYKNLTQLMHHPPRVGENYSSSSIRIQVRMEIPRTVARAEEQKIKRLNHRIDDPTTEHKRQGCTSEG